MVVGEALSSLIDKGDKKMDFKVDEMSTPEAKWYKSLVNVTDTVGSIQSLKPGAVVELPRKPQPKPKKPASKPKAAQAGSKIIAIEEIETDEGEEENSDNDGLVPYTKPDSDAEDSEEDATLVTRNKPTAPVYIRDLITYLRDTENYDRQKLGLTTAAPLIRRKANFGKEVSAHAEELATLLVGLQDKYKIENFQDMRLQGMISVLIALPLQMGQWFSKTLFDGDYSLSQRASILTTLGLGAREIGGLGAENAAISSLKELPPSVPSFPSKTLAPAIHSIYISQPQKESLLNPSHNPPKRPSNENNAISILSSNLSTTLLRPLATSIAEKAAGPDIFKVQSSRTFSTRMAVESKRSKPTTNNLAKVVAEGFFFPLTGRFSLHLRASSSSAAVISQPYLLAHFIKTLGLLLHASGPNTLSLPQMTSEFFDLLLAVRTKALGDIVVMEGILFGFLAILEINEDKRTLVEDQGRQLLETQEWVESVFSRLSAAGGASEEDAKVKILAAGVLIRIRECVEKYQALLMGDLASF
jgi:telomere length regulation protein